MWILLWISLCSFVREETCGNYGAVFPCWRSYCPFLTDIGASSQMVSLERDIESLPSLGRINSIGLETYVHANSLFHAVEVIFKRDVVTTFADEDGSVGGEQD